MFVRQIPPRALRLIDQAGYPLFLSHLHELEIPNAIRSKRFRGEITPVQERAALGAFRSDVESRFLSAIFTMKAMRKEGGGKKTSFMFQKPHDGKKVRPGGRPFIENHPCHPWLRISPRMHLPGMDQQLPVAAQEENGEVF